MLHALSGQPAAAIQKRLAGPESTSWRSGAIPFVKKG